MKKSIFYFSAALLALTAVSCNKESANVPEAKEAQVVSLTLQGTWGIDTKTTTSMDTDYGSINSVWAGDEKVFVYSKKTGNKIGELAIDAESVSTSRGSTDQYATSSASFTGNVTFDGTNDKVTDQVNFFYLGKGNDSKAGASEISAYTISAITSEENIAIFDIGYASNAIQGGTADGTVQKNATCSVTFTNVMSFGYYTTKVEGLDTNLQADYYSSFQINSQATNIDDVFVTTALTSGKVSLPDNADFYLPLIKGTKVDLSCGRLWTGTTSYTETNASSAIQSVARSTFYRLGKSDNYGPIKMKKNAAFTYNYLEDELFDVSDSGDGSSLVGFTQGNLQVYAASNGDLTWAIAMNQYEALRNNQELDGDNYFIPYNGNDLFQWGDVGSTGGKFSASTTYPDAHKGGQGADAAHLKEANNWANLPKIYIDRFTSPATPFNSANYSLCTLTNTEWGNLMKNQYSGYATVQIDGTSTKVQGLIVLPKNIVTDEAAAELGNFVKNASNSTSNFKVYGNNNILYSEVIAKKMLFLPCAGYRNAGSGFVCNATDNGNYWSSVSSGTSAYYLRFNTSVFNPQGSDARTYGRSVRLALKKNS